VRTYELVHTTRYEYEAPVARSYGRAHLTPHDSPGQRCLSTSLEITPQPADLSEHVDYFGNVSTFYLVRRSHTVLTVTARSRLEVDRDQPRTAPALAVGWEQVRDRLAEFPLIGEYRLASPRVQATADVADYAQTVFTPGRPIGACVDELVGQIYRDFTYKSGATTVRTTLSQLLRKREGVCQDFAHLAVGAMRSVGLAARYISGYIETQPPPGQQKLQGADASHAWASVFIPDYGWLDVDPTNNQWVDDRYLVVACGRDYSDVPPLKGVIVTDSLKSSMLVSVDVNRI
jgi:transglutaminase-like putative cysteine protease